MPSLGSSSAGIVNGESGASSAGKLFHAAEYIGRPCSRNIVSNSVQTSGGRGIAGTFSNLASFAKHYQTGEVIPDSLIAKLNKASKFNQGFVQTELLSASILDMDFHKLTTADGLDVNAFEAQSMEKMGMIPEIIVRYRPTFYNHIFTTGYAAGYYGYKWAEVLDADACSLFKEKGIFNQEVANSFRTNVLSKGGTEHPMTLYKRFRGQEPSIDALLRRNGITNP